MVESDSATFVFEKTKSKRENAQKSRHCPRSEFVFLHPPNHDLSAHMDNKMAAVQRMNASSKPSLFNSHAPPTSGFDSAYKYDWRSPESGRLDNGSYPPTIDWRWPEGNPRSFHFPDQPTYDDCQTTPAEQQRVLDIARRYADERSGQTSQSRAPTSQRKPPSKNRLKTNTNSTRRESASHQTSDRTAQSSKPNSGGLKFSTNHEDFDLNETAKANTRMNGNRPRKDTLAKLKNTGRMFLGGSSENDTIDASPTTVEEQQRLLDVAHQWRDTRSGQPTQSHAYDTTDASPTTVEEQQRLLDLAHQWRDTRSGQPTQSHAHDTTDASPTTVEEQQRLLDLAHQWRDTRSGQPTQSQAPTSQGTFTPLPNTWAADWAKAKPYTRPTPSSNASGQEYMMSGALQESDRGRTYSDFAGIVDNSARPTRSDFDGMMTDTAKPKRLRSCFKGSRRAERARPSTR
jgi:hypothetical protein